MSRNIYGEEVCDKTQMVTNGCSHCTGRHGDGNVVAIDSWGNVVL